LISSGEAPSMANRNPSRMRPVFLSWANSSTETAPGVEGEAMSNYAASDTFQSRGNSMVEGCFRYANARESEDARVSCTRILYYGTVRCTILFCGFLTCCDGFLDCFGGVF
jgi:hypothetical protein